jgi:hypothetical protein
MPLSANRKLQRRNAEHARKYSALIGSTAKVYQDAFVGINATGFMVPQAESTSIQPGGIAIIEYAVGDGTTVYGEYETNLEVFVPTANVAGTVVITMQKNTVMYATDDGTVTNVATLGSQLGIMTEFSTAGIWLLLGGSVQANAS